MEGGGQYTISSIIIIVWLIFPGIVFKRFYYQGQFSKQFGTGLFADRLITSIFWGVFVQLITFLVYSRALNFTFIGIEADVEGYYKNLAENKLPLISYKTLIYILGYQILLVIMALILGTIVHKTIRFLKIDVHSSIFRFTNHWNYYFRGEILSTAEFKSLKIGKWISTQVDILIDDGTEKNKMVSGYLTQYTLSHKTGDLETIYLTSATRFSQTQNKFITIPGDCLIVQFGKVVDMNIRYNQVKSTLDKRKIISSVVFIFGFVVLISIFVFPWYLNINVVSKVLGTVSALVTWLFLMAILIFPLQRGTNPKMTQQAVWISLFIMIVFLFLTLVWFRLI
ncbi:MAG: hypothetical protein JWP45_3585 [Mucilaginibacter sp.]|nr:hypothetical protein [Mucilaginibacter sp.]